MNYRLLSILMMVAMIAGCAKPSPNIVFKDLKTEQIIHYSQMKDIEDISNYVIYLNKGDKILVKTTLDSDLVDIAHGEINLVLKKKVYFKVKMLAGENDNLSAMSEEEKQKFLKNIMIYLSPDTKRWASYTDFKAVKKMFGIQGGGSISFGMGVTKEEGLKLFLNIKTATS